MRGAEVDAPSQGGLACFADSLHICTVDMWCSATPCITPTSSLVSHCHRRAYQRAIVVPCHALDALYRDYEGFENSLGDKTLTRKVGGREGGWTSTGAHCRPFSVSP